MNKYQDSLDRAKKNNINVFDLIIATEVNEHLSSKDNKFESICDLVKDIWLKLDNHISLSSVVNGVIKEYADYKSKKINKSELIDIICQIYA